MPVATHIHDMIKCDIDAPPLWVAIKDIDIYSGMREGQRTMISGVDVTEDQRRASIVELEDENKKKGIGGWAKAAAHQPHNIAYI